MFDEIEKKTLIKSYKSLTRNISTMIIFSAPLFFPQVTFILPSLGTKVTLLQTHIAFIYPYFFTDINECSDGSHTCSSYATCMDTIGNYTCKCPDKGFKGDGHKCTGMGNIRKFHLCYFLRQDIFSLFQHRNYLFNSYSDELNYLVEYIKFFTYFY